VPQREIASLIIPATSEAGRDPDKHKQTSICKMAIATLTKGADVLITMPDGVPHSPG
jgi:hypothetical protein